jgi:hypothetical protein
MATCLDPIVARRLCVWISSWTGTAFQQIMVPIERSRCLLWVPRALGLGVQILLGAWMSTVSREVLYSQRSCRSPIKRPLPNIWRIRCFRISYESEQIKCSSEIRIGIVVPYQLKVKIPGSRIVFIFVSENHLGLLVLPPHLFPFIIH